MRSTWMARACSRCRTRRRSWQPGRRAKQRPRATAYSARRRMSTRTHCIGARTGWSFSTKRWRPEELRARVKIISKSEGAIMQRKDIKIGASGGGEFDCYVVIPDADGKVPGIVLASAIHGVDADLRAIADDFAGHGYVVAAPDLFWRSVPGPLTRDDPRSPGRAHPRLEKINAAEADMAAPPPIPDKK